MFLDRYIKIILWFEARLFLFFMIKKKKDDLYPFWNYYIVVNSLKIIDINLLITLIKLMMNWILLIIIIKNKNLLL